MFRIFFALSAIVAPALAYAEPPDRVMRYGSGDKRMNAAIARAQATLPAFETALQAGKGTRFTVKVRVPYGPSTSAEHLWLVDIRLDGHGGYFGIVANDVYDVPTLHMGSPFHAVRSAVSDWMYTDGRGVHGGYTVRVMMEDMSPSERAKNDLKFVD